MSGLSDYAVSIVVIVGTMALATFLSYKGELAPTERCAAAIIVAATAILPIGELISSITVTPPTVEDFIGGELEYEAVGEGAFCDGVTLLIAEKYGLKQEEVRVAVEGFSFEAMRAERITVILSGGAVIADAPAIESYISSLEIGECTVEIEI